jgi:predicted esterase YcpF (UPF0227 family)
VILYIHGFNSSCASFKARVLKERLTARGEGGRFACIDLPHWPGQAIARLESLIESRRDRPITLVGSSLGGYYATWLAEKYDLRAVLINPAVRPYELLQPALGPNRNLYTGEEYQLTDEHLRQLQALEVPALTHPARYLLLVGDRDEVLDHRKALERYRGAAQIVVEGGDHGLSDFAGYLEPILDFSADS